MKESSTDKVMNAKSDNQYLSGGKPLYISHKKSGLTYNPKKGNISKTDLREVLARSIRSNKKSSGFNKLNISYNIKITEDFYSNPNYIQFIFDQLIDNAIASIDMVKSASFMNIDLVADAYILKLEILDNGIGLQPTIIDESINSATLREYSNYDIGLHLMKQFINRLSGKIHHDSASGVGTHVLVEIPNFCNF